MIDRRQMILGMALAAGGGAAGLARLRPATDLQIDPRAAAPDRVGQWRAGIPREVVLPQQSDLETRIYDDLVIRSYHGADRPPITLVLAYGQRQNYSFQMHRPEICYPASGFRVASLSETCIDVGETCIPGNAMFARRGKRSETVLYWTRIGTSFPQSIWEQRLAVLRGVKRWRIEEGALLRLAVPGPDFEAGKQMLTQFASLLLGHVGPAGRRILIGRFKT